MELERLLCFRMIMGQNLLILNHLVLERLLRVPMLINCMQTLILIKQFGNKSTDGQEQINVGGKLMNSRAYVAKFNFSGSRSNIKVGVLSGGRETSITFSINIKKRS